jgi:hypothetical protein
MNISVIGTIILIYAKIRNGIKIASFFNVKLYKQELIVFPKGSKVEIDGAS